MRNAWRVFGSSSQSGANHEAYPVVSPFGASTSIHWSPFVTSPSRTPVSCSSCIIRVSGDAAHGFPSTTRPSFCLSGYVWIKSLAFEPPGSMTTLSGRRVSPCSGRSALSVCGMSCPSTSTSPRSSVFRSTQSIHW